MAEPEDRSGWLGKEVRDRVTFVLTTVTATIAIVGSVLWGTGKLERQTAEQELQNLYIGTKSMPTIDTEWGENMFCSRVPVAEGADNAEGNDSVRYNYNAVYSARNAGELLYHIEEVQFRLYKVPVAFEDEYQGEGLTFRALNTELENPAALVPNSEQAVRVEENFFATNTMEVAFNFDLTQAKNTNYYLEAIAQGGLLTPSNTRGILGIPAGETNEDSEDPYRVRFGGRDLRLVIPLNCEQSNSNWTTRPLAAPKREEQSDDQT